MKKGLDRNVKGLDMEEKYISEFEDMLVKIFIMKQRKKDEKKEERISELGNIKCFKMQFNYEIFKVEEEDRNIFEKIMINVF